MENLSSSTQMKIRHWGRYKKDLETEWIFRHTCATSQRHRRHIKTVIVTAETTWHQSELCHNSLLHRNIARLQYTNLLHHITLQHRHTSGQQIPIRLDVRDDILCGISMVRSSERLLMNSTLTCNDPSFCMWWERSWSAKGGTAWNRVKS